jgi:cysteine desulfurase/selenocysteine lyase
MEHHSNIVPWQLVCEQTGAELKVIPINKQGEIIWDAFEQMLNPKVKMLAVVHVSNALGTINPIKRMITAAHAQDIPVLIDGAQAAPHLAVDVVDLDCDFYCVSGHKMFGPTGIGVLYGKRQVLESMPPYQGGGEMIKQVSFEGTSYNDLPFRFEAGTPNIAGAIGLGASAHYLSGLGLDQLRHYESELLAYATAAIEQIPGLRIIGTARDKVAVISFSVDNVHPNDLGTILDHQGVAIRTGHHCTMPLMDFFGLPGTARASLAFYNTREEVDHFAVALQRGIKMLA